MKRLLLLAAMFFAACFENAQPPAAEEVAAPVAPVVISVQRATPQGYVAFDGDTLTVDAGLPIRGGVTLSLTGGTSPLTPRIAKQAQEYVGTADSASFTESKGVYSLIARASRFPGYIVQYELSVTDSVGASDTTWFAIQTTVPAGQTLIPSDGPGLLITDSLWVTTFHWEAAVPRDGFDELQHGSFTWRKHVTDGSLLLSGHYDHHTITPHIHDGAFAVVVEGHYTDSELEAYLRTRLQNFNDFWPAFKAGRPPYVVR